jgi:hypothetical protein
MNSNGNADREALSKVDEPSAQAAMTNDVYATAAQPADLASAFPEAMSESVEEVAESGAEMLETVAEVPETIDETESYESLLHGFLSDIKMGKYSNISFEKLKIIVTKNSDALALAQELIMSSEVDGYGKSVLVDLISDRADESAIGLAMQLINSSDTDDQSAGMRLAHEIMANGNPSVMLEAVAMNTYTEENRRVAAAVLHGVVDAEMDENEKNRVFDMLSDYVTNGDDALKSSALYSMGALIAGDEEKLASLFNQYHTKEYSDEVRYSAVMAMDDLAANNRLSPDIENKLMDIANDQSESYYLRSLAMRLLGDLQASYEKSMNTTQM